MHDLDENKFNKDKYIKYKMTIWWNWKQEKRTVYCNRGMTELGRTFFSSCSGPNEPSVKEHYMWGSFVFMKRGAQHTLAIMVRSQALLSLPDNPNARAPPYRKHHVLLSPWSIYTSIIIHLVFKLQFLNNMLLMSQMHVFELKCNKRKTWHISLSYRTVKNLRNNPNWYI